MGDSGQAFLTLLSRYALHDRRLRAASGALRGLMAGLAAGLLASLLLFFAPLPVPRAAAVVACLVFGVTAGAAVGFAGRADTASLVSRMDRALQSRCLLVTALELAPSAAGRVLPAGGTLYREVLLDEAGRLLSSADPGSVLPLSVPARLRWVPALLAGILLLSAVPADLRSLFARRAAPDDDIASIGRELEEYGRKLTEDADRRGLPRSLEIGRALQRLGQELETEPMEAEEARERMEDLEERMQRMQLAGRPGSPDPGGTGPQGEGQAERKIGEGQGEKGLEKGREGGDGSDGGEASEDERELESARDFLGEKKGTRRLGRSEGGKAGEGAEGADGNGGEGGGSGDAEEGRPGSSAKSSEPGTAAVPDAPGPPTDIASPFSNPESVSPELRGDDYARLLLRILPVPEEGMPAQPAPEAVYRRLAESVLSRDDVPLELRGFVKDYFLRIGVLGE